MPRSNNSVQGLDNMGVGKASLSQSTGHSVLVGNRMECMVGCSKGQVTVVASEKWRLGT